MEKAGPVHAELKKAAAKMKPGLSKRNKAILLHDRKEFQHLSVERIRS
jgi:hypothetical protein